MEKTNDVLLSDTIRFLRFPLTVGIVFIHFSLAEGLGINGIKHGLDNPGWFFFIVNYVSEVISRIGVPLFFVISGFLFFYKVNFSIEVYKSKLLTRFYSLFVPFLAWNIIAILWRFRVIIPGVSSFFSPIEVRFTFQRLLNTIFFNNNGIFISNGGAIGLYPIDVPLWYVRELMLMVLISPLIYWLIKKIGIGFTIFIGLIWFLTPNGGGYFPSFITALFFFTTGSYFSINNKNFALQFSKLKYVPYIYIIISIMDALLIVKKIDYDIYLHKIGVVLGVIAIVGITYNLLMQKRIKIHPSLEKSSFFIFALHYLFISDIGKIMFIVLHIPENNPVAMLLLFFVVPILTTLLCYMLFFLTNRYIPKFCNILTGGRQKRKS